MKREINFGGHSAQFCAGEHRAMLTINEQTLPVVLADAINEAGDLTVTEVFKRDDKTYIRMVHDLKPGELLGIICEAIGEVYDADTSIAYARPENAL